MPTDMSVPHSSDSCFVKSLTANQRNTFTMTRQIKCNSAFWQARREIKYGNVLLNEFRWRLFSLDE